MFLSLHVICVNWKAIILLHVTWNVSFGHTEYESNLKKNINIALHKSLIFTYVYSSL